jgi:hypothetical protein
MKAEAVICSSLISWNLAQCLGHSIYLFIAHVTDFTVQDTGRFPLPDMETFSLDIHNHHCSLQKCFKYNLEDCVIVHWIQEQKLEVLLTFLFHLKINKKSSFANNISIVEYLQNLERNIHIFEVYAQKYFTD